jgi:hypothetical protein
MVDRIRGADGRHGGSELLIFVQRAAHRCDLSLSRSGTWPPVPRQEVLRSPCTRSVRSGPLLKRAATSPQRKIAAMTTTTKMGFHLRGPWPRQRRPGPPLQRRQPCRRGKLPATVPLIFSADETVDLGRDTGSPVSDDYTPATSVFIGDGGLGADRRRRGRRRSLHERGGAVPHRDGASVTLSVTAGPEGDLCLAVVGRGKFTSRR